MRLRELHIGDTCHSRLIALQRPLLHISHRCPPMLITSRLPTARPPVCAKLGICCNSAPQRPKTLQKTAMSARTGTVCSRRLLRLAPVCPAGSAAARSATSAATQVAACVRWLCPAAVCPTGSASSTLVAQPFGGTRNSRAYARPVPTVLSWASASYPNWTSSTEATDRDAVSTGVAVAYIYGMRSASTGQLDNACA